MGKYDTIKEGEKLPGTYCPVCGEIGLRKMIFEKIEWAICPMDSEMNATVTKVKDAHTGYQLEPKTVPVKTAGSTKPEIEDEEGVENG